MHLVTFFYRFCAAASHTTRTASRFRQFEGSWSKIYDGEMGAKPLPAVLRCYDRLKEGSHASIRVPVRNVYR